MEKPVVGFLGLGKMGLPMSLNLVRGGYEVHGYDVVPRSLKAFASEGGKACASVHDVVRAADVLCASLPGPAEVTQVFGEVVAQEGRSGQLVIDFSTVSPQVNHRVAEALARRGIDYLGAPVSGGVERAVDGTLTVMVGGAKAAFDRAKPMLDLIGQNVFHISEDVGAGSVVKLVNNYFIGYYTLAVAEALTLAGEMGMDLEQLFSILNVSYGQSRIYERNWKLFISKDFYEPGFTTRLLIKDLHLAKDMAAAKGLELPMTDVLIGMYEKAAERGYADLDMAAMYRYIQDVKNEPRA
ncbi:NAD(P)-dependent oxidoreductase [Alicyclobacillus acidocaldarius]|uniref:3-hydroxyisobutyrate dehydrogenase n=1 Tax=Alicyclobacillus acidocaldarius subsp. acidocaldarius (strain ATCC 27009 / DSM 446 / BCRC 14685 / JCM 5260 / KCTC 1825 / NBRC 15652 / NCIMB 11725 / NRRL B-14509 / 104-IA) TaxID=521098 RepID=C8WWK7_ALIAD|nr:NAD(P)-dependent oxidoreductase [Alicyclobacillus acidocaldarius]ACV58478.1 3-hydroxyisobutyrate dehydrogenase [Alicyclobacillus acidocaldarius subsp. acidocaldarius DSM 446]